MDKQNSHPFILIGRILCLIAILFITGCGTATPGIPVAEPEQPVEVPEEQVEPAGEVSQNPLPLEFPTLSLPAADAEALFTVAQDNGLDAVDLALDNTVIYANNDLANSNGTGNGAAYLLTPSFLSFDIQAEDLAADPGKLIGRMLGGLTVVEQLQAALPIDHYVLSLGVDDAAQPQVWFTGATTTVVFDGAIRRMPFPTPRPVALITAQQICLTWDITQICALLDTPPQNWIVSRLETAIANLGVSPGSYNLGLAVPDIEGVEALNRCVDGLNLKPADYSQCRANILAVPSVDELPPPPERPSGEYHLGVMAVLDPIREEVYEEPELITPLDGIEPGDYVVQELIRDDDSVTPTEQALQTRVGLFDPSGVGVFLPAVSRGTIVGQILSGTGPEDGLEAVITNLWLRGCCFYKKWQCKWLL